MGCKLGPAGSGLRNVALLAPERGHTAGSYPTVSLYHCECIEEGLDPACEQPADEVGALDGPHSCKAEEHDAAVGPGLEDDKLAEVLVIREKHPTNGDRSPQYGHVRYGRSQLRNPLHVVSVRPEPGYHGDNDVLVRQDHEAC